MNRSEKRLVTVHRKWIRYNLISGKPGMKARTIKLSNGMSILLLVLLTNILNAQESDNFSSGKVSFFLKFKDEISPYEVMSMFVLPDELLNLEIVADSSQNFTCQTEHGVLTGLSPLKWRWKAPGIKGHFIIMIHRQNSTETMTINAFVMVPYTELNGEYLNNYRIGNYPKIPFRQLAIYKPPKGFIEVTPENEHIFLSPHFKLKQFLCKQAGDYPKYLVLRERLLLKLELVLEKVNEQGYHCHTFTVMSGYRTPYYNKAIGNGAYSRHVWGGAADIYIDVHPRDGMMDDLNKDGIIDYRDAEILHNIIDNLYGQPWYERFIGGLASYRRTSNHGPYMHIDVRGFRARWGK
jgi:hypothetical protein